MLSSDGLAGHLLNVRLGPTIKSCQTSDRKCLGRAGGDSHVTKGNHTDGLPDTKTDAWSNATVKATDAVLAVNVTERVADRHLLGTVGILLLALHLDTDNLNRLVPGTEATTNGRGQNLLPGAKLLLFALAGHGLNSALSQTTETEARAPVGHLADGHSVDTLVNTTDTLAAVDVHESGEGGLGLDTGSGHLVLGDLDSLHAGAEAHGSVGLSHTTSDTTDDATSEVIGAGGTSMILGLGSDEEEDSTLGGSLDPGPGDEALVEAQDAATTPDAAESGAEPVTAVGGHCGLDDLEGLAEGGDLEHVETGTKQQVGELDGLLLQLLGLANGGGQGGSGGHVGSRRVSCLSRGLGGPDQGRRVLLRGEREKLESLNDGV